MLKAHKYVFHMCSTPGKCLLLDHFTHVKPVSHVKCKILM